MTSDRSYLPVVFTDLTASKLAAGSLPDYVYAEFLRAHSRIALETARRVSAERGLPHKPTNLGDGNLFFFNEADEALIFALCLSARWKAYRRDSIRPCLGGLGEADARRVLRMRGAVHFGLIQHENLEEFASELNLSRALSTAHVLNTRAEPGEVLASETVLSLTEGRFYDVEHRGRFDPLGGVETEDEASRAGMLTHYVVEGMSAPPGGGEPLVGLPRVQRRRLARDWYWYAFYLTGIRGAILEAVTGFRRVVEYNPELARAWNNLGSLLTELADLSAARSALERAIELNPDSAAFHANLSAARYAAGDFAGAGVAARRAVELDPDLETAQFNLGNALWEEGRLEEAANCFRRSWELNPAFHQAPYNLACVQSVLERFDEALAALERALELRPELIARAIEDEDLAKLRGHPRFAELTTEI